MTCMVDSNGEGKRWTASDVFVQFTFFAYHICYQLNKNELINCIKIPNATFSVDSMHEHAFQLVIFIFLFHNVN